MLTLGSDRREILPGIIAELNADFFLNRIGIGLDQGHAFFVQDLVFRDLPLYVGQLLDRAGCPHGASAFGTAPRSPSPPSAAPLCRCCIGSCIRHDFSLRSRELRTTQPPVLRIVILIHPG